MNKLVLGTVQMGLDYGINNQQGQISEANSFEILKYAHASGIKYLDTAEVYGNAHSLIGTFHKEFPACTFNIITKFPKLESQVEFERKINRFVETLQVKKINCLMFHSYESYKENMDKSIFLKIKKQNLFEKLGVSVYTNNQALDVIKDDMVDVIQLPFNLLDNFQQRGKVLLKAKESGKEIHTRSVFLQGLFFKNLESINKNSSVKKIEKELRYLHELADFANCSMETLALKYCMNQENIDKVIIGVDSVNHLKNNIEAINSSNLTKDIFNKIDDIFVEDAELLNPSLWQT